MEHFSIEELKEKYRKSKKPVESRRWHLLWKISLGETIKNSAEAVGLSDSYAQKIVKRYNRQGAAGVKDLKNQTSNHPRGKKKILSEQQLEKLKEVIQQKPADAGIWTGPKVARWIEKETGKEKVWNQRGWDYLKKCEYSLQSPRPQHRKGDKLEQEIYKGQFPAKKEKIRAKLSQSRDRYLVFR